MKIKSILLIVFAAAAFIYSCKKDKLISDPSAKINFSVDTVLFDTIFTTIGSTTKNFKVYNPHNKSIKISEISLAKGINSKFRLNIDGEPTSSKSDVVILPKDSLFIFVEVTIDPTNSNDPLVVKDSVVFKTNGNIQDIDLVAWGQDAYFHANEVLKPCQAIWRNNKPHVIYGTVLIDSACKLTIRPGTQIHFHKNSQLIIYKGSMDVMGETLEDPVVFQGDRLEADYDNLPGQWGRIYFLRASDSQINYSIIKNAVIGLQVDTFSESATTGLTIKNSIIKNMDLAGLYAQSAKIKMENTLIHNCAQYCAVLAIGGEYRVNHCSFINFWSDSRREDPLFVLNNYFKDQFGKIHVWPLKNTRIDNTIIYGSNIEEFLVDIKAGAEAEYKFNHCIIRAEEQAPVEPNFNQIYLNDNPQLKRDDENDLINYSIDTLSFSIGKADINTSLSIDILGAPRDVNPDLGAFERIE